MAKKMVEVLSLSLSLSLSAHATSVAPATLAQMLEGDRVAVEADVLAIRYGFIEIESETWPVTLIDLDVVQVVGSTGATPTTLLLPGGPREDDVWVTIVGTPTPSVGERLMLLGEVDVAGVLRLSAFYLSYFVRSVDSHVLSSTGSDFAAFDCRQVPTPLVDDPGDEDGASPVVSLASAVRWDELMAAVVDCDTVADTNAVQP